MRLLLLFGIILLGNIVDPSNAQTFQVEEIKRVPQHIDYGASWSSDGQSIVFVSNRNGPLNIYSMRWDGNNIVRLTNHPEEDDSPSISPDGSKIAFTSYRDGNPEIYIMDVDGQNLQQLTSDLGEDIHPFWSADGSQIIFNSTRDDPDSTDQEELYEIYVMDPEGKNKQRVTKEGGVNTYAFFSPDGERIVFRKIVAGNSEIFIMDADGGNHINISNNPSFDGWPAWSPNGEKIAFASNREGNYNVYIMNTDGSNQQKIHGVLGRHTGPIWSPDGTKLVFTRSLNSEARILRLSLEKE